MSSNINLLEKMIHVSINEKYIEIPPTEEEFEQEAILLREAMSNLCCVTDDEFSEIKRRLKSSLIIQMDVGVFIEDRASGHKSWLPARRAEIDFFFWKRYKQYLEIEKQWNTRVTASLEKISDEIIDLLGDPQSKKSFQRRGLILGDVQSGKTANYTAICNKAADTGYRIIIVLAGMMENLRMQTQERLDLEFSGRQSKYLLDPKASAGYRDHFVGVGKYGKENRIASFTSVIKDFDINVLKSNDLSLHSVNDTVLLVVKKNKSILTNLYNWLVSNSADQTTNKIDLPLLLIDDEADNASVNTRSEEDNPAAINTSIRKLLNVFSQASYVGITATPFANIFINPDTVDEMLGDDLFPKDFIYALTPPSNYIGADSIFGEEPEYFNALVPIKNYEMDSYFPFNHKKEDRVKELPPSMLEAMGYFILANVIRDARGDNAQHRSMMIHVSRFTDVQNHIASLANEWLIQMRSDIQNYAKLPKANEIPNITFLKCIWDKFDLKSKTELHWDEVLKDYLIQAVSPIDVRAVNQSTGSTSLDYYNHSDNGLRVIAIGGNSLSRGLTLEGLIVSYFYRKSQMYDTLLQMGRWFGFRENYSDLIKIWMSIEAIDWYGYITLSINELKGEIANMRFANLTPMEFGLKVRQDPNSLIATARNKMRSAQPVSRPVTVSGRLLETPRLKTNREALETNEKAFRSFVKGLEKVGERDNKEKSYFWKDVNKESVIQLINQFQTHPWHMSFQGAALANYIADQMDGKGWDVAIPEGEGNKVKFFCGDQTIMVKSQRRKVSVRNNQISISGSKLRVGSGGATKLGLSEEDRKIARSRFKDANPNKKNVPDSAYLLEGRNPILFLYVIEVNTEKSEILSDINIPEYLYALGVGFPSTGERTKTANYMVNTIEQRYWMDPDEDYDE